MASLWQDGVKQNAFAPLKGHHHADVLIIGGGITGVLCAHYLHKQGVDCLLLEANSIGGGTTAHTTAKITAQHGLIYQKLLSRRGADFARAYYDAHTEAIQEYRTLAKSIPCDFVTTDNLIYSRLSEAVIDRELEALDKIGRPEMLAENLPLPFSTKGAVRFANQAMFHPQKFLAHLLRGLPIHESSPVTELSGHTAITPHGQVTADNVIIATHFPFLNGHGLYWMRLYQSRSYVLALEGAPLPQDMYVDAAESGLSFRRYKNLLLLGGGGKRTGKPCGGWDSLERFARRHYPNATIHYRWAAQDCMSLDSLPYIGQYAAGMPHLYVATGFNKWGMTSALVAAKILTDRILERSSPYAALFSPARAPALLPLAENAVSAIAGMLTPTIHRCTHLGCGLHYNRREHSWDCPCHGSRYSHDGDILDGPAKKAIKNRIEGV